jgi:hypothetical protein
MIVTNRTQNHSQCRTETSKTSRQKHKLHDRGLDDSAHLPPNKMVLDWVHTYRRKPEVILISIELNDRIFCTYHIMHWGTLIMGVPYSDPKTLSIRAKQSYHLGKIMKKGRRNNQHSERPPAIFHCACYLWAWVHLLLMKISSMSVQD